jgi:DNA-binding NtrC family response regulator
MKTKILLVDDDVSLAGDISKLLEDTGYEVRHAGLLGEAKERWKTYQPDICLLDLNLPDGDGLDFLDVVISEDADMSVLILSGYGNIPVAIEAIKKGAEDFFTKPVDPDHLLLYLEKLILRRRLHNQALLHSLDMAAENKSIIGESQEMKEMLGVARTAASSHSSILVTGESGTGKHLIAHLIHQNSPRNQEAFVYINCATLSENLLESDLFGHERGAFTGAHKMKKGRVEIANRGTLFLDEIGEIALDLQAKLLHFLEYGEYQRVGGTDTWKADVRVVCATNRDLQKEVSKGRFRQDLFYRINVIQLEIPALRERIGDIPILIDYFVNRFAKDLGKSVLPLADKTMERLCNYSWPGNVRELQNAVERAMVLCQAKRLTDKDFPFLTTPLDGGDELFRPRPLQQAVSEFKATYIRQLLKQTGKNQSKAAEVLKIQRTYLNRLIKELEIHHHDG